MDSKTLTGLGVGVAIGLAVGGLLGYQAGQAGRVTAAPTPQASAPMPGAPQLPPSGNPHDRPVNPSLLQAIPAMEKVAAQQPQNRAAWVQLGNAYFDTNQRQKAIEAYQRALDLNPNDPNVITDQGVMFHETGRHDEALRLFEKAHALDPTHVDSLFNQGVVYLDKQDVASAKRVWGELVQKAPQTPQAARARAQLERLGP